MTLTRGLGRRAVALAAVLAALWCGAEPAAASQWTAHSLAGEAAQAQLFGISCPATSLCVAVGGNNTIASSTSPTAAGGWNAVYVDEGVKAGSPNQRQLKGVSCPSTNLCVAVSFLGKIVTSTDPTGPASAWSVADLNPAGPNTHLYGVSCPTTTFCAAAAGGGQIAVSTNPAGGAGAWTVTQLPAPLELRGIACTSPSFCVAVGDSGTNIRPEPSNLGEVVSSTAPLAGIWSQAELSGAHGSLYGVACPSTTFCVSGDMFGNVLVSTDPTGPASTWHSTATVTTVQITAAACAGVARCLLASNNGDAISSTQPESGPWTVQNLIAYSREPFIPNALFSASCPSGEFCAIGATGQVLTSADPLAPPPAPAKPPAAGGKKKTKKHKPRPKRPRVILAEGSSPPAIVVPHGKAFLQFRFHVSPKFQVRGYVCSLDGQKMHRCKSPRRYRVGTGHHVFRVRAVGWTGLRGPVASRPVQVCRHSAMPYTCTQR